MSRTMTAFRLVDWQQPARFCEVPVPEPRHDEVLVRVGGVGLCHSDILFLDAPPGRFPYEVPFTLGHENAGWVEEVGSGVDDLGAGDAVLIDAHWICGSCEYCRRGYDNYCLRGAGKIQGAGADGGLAHYLVAPRRNVVPIGALDPAEAAPLADAGRTSYHAVRRALTRMPAAANVLVIGAGGLGGYAIQWLRALSAANVIVTDVAAHRRTIARELGAHEVVESGSATVTAVRDLTGGKGVDAVFDFVGTDGTIAIATASARPLSTIALVGAGGGTLGVQWGSLPLECEVFIPQGGTHPELHEVVELAKRGLVRSRIQRFDFTDTVEAYERLRSGDLDGRAVVEPNK